MDLATGLFYAAFLIVALGIGAIAFIIPVAAVIIGARDRDWKEPEKEFSEIEPKGEIGEVAETWEIAMRRVIKEYGHNVIAGYSYGVVDGECVSWHRKDTIVIMLDCRGKYTIGYIYDGERRVNVYGREFFPVIKGLLQEIKEKLGYEYSPILKAERPLRR